ncbi:hypothetical protein CBR_g37750 [Chara braunii]|uniref:CCHC-type domain-containing protein n=1 Tax=Chara braunii TaxID=69332 RepID=A0A388LNN8_CHABU|nr:hypothetical protein CBR_g37750 [Chara braunii]|eukprot:GBG83881.1 hypothetical protein CBR_g37750 [Chara braunii]
MEEFDRHMEELKNLVTKALEKKGVLSKIRAELRANIFETIEEQDDDTSGDDDSNRGLADVLSGCNQQSKALHASPLGKLLADLICEYLEWCELDHTLKVYLPEGKLPPRYAKRSQLEEELGISPSVSKGLLPSRPLLAEILEAYCKSRVAVQRAAGTRVANGSWREHSFKADMRVVDGAHRSGREDVPGLTPSGYSSRRREGVGVARSMDIEREGYRVTEFRRSLDMERDGRRSMDMDRDTRTKEAERDARRMDMDRDLRSPVEEVAPIARGGYVGFKSAGPSFSENNFDGVKRFHGSIPNSRASSMDHTTPLSVVASTVYEVRSNNEFNGADISPIGRNSERDEAEMLAAGGLLGSRGSFSVPTPVEAALGAGQGGASGFPVSSGGIGVAPGSFGAGTAGMIVEGINSTVIASNVGSFGLGVSSGSYGGSGGGPGAVAPEQGAPSQQETHHRRGSSLQMANDARSRIATLSSGPGAVSTEVMEHFVCPEVTKEGTIQGRLERTALKWCTSFAAKQNLPMDKWAQQLKVEGLLQALRDRFADREQARKAADKILLLGSLRFEGSVSKLYGLFESLTATPGLEMSEFDQLTHFLCATPPDYSIALYSQGHKDWRSIGKAALDLESRLKVQEPSEGRRRPSSRGQRRKKGALLAADAGSDSDASQCGSPSSETASVSAVEPTVLALAENLAAMFKGKVGTSTSEGSAIQKGKGKGRASSPQAQRANLPRDVHWQVNVMDPSTLPRRALRIQEGQWQKRKERFGPVSHLMQEPTGLVHRQTQHRIELLPGAVPPKGRIFRMSPVELEELRRQLETLTSKGWIKPSTSEFGAPVLFVPKGNGEFRMCIDYKGLNKITRKSTEPLPRIDDLLDMVQGCTIFSKIDLKSGYHQIEMAEGDVHKTAFKTRYDTYEYLVMPFGLCNAPDTFQTEMHCILRPYLDRFVVLYLDDILVFSRSVEEHAQHLALVIQALHEAQYKINRDKSSFGVTSVTYLGHVISGEGLAPEATKVVAIQDWPQPTTSAMPPNNLPASSYGVVTCHICGKVGHYAKNCWQAANRQKPKEENTEVRELLLRISKREKEEDRKKKEVEEARKKEEDERRESEKLREEQAREAKLEATIVRILQQRKESGVISPIPLIAPASHVAYEPKKQSPSSKARMLRDIRSYIAESEDESEEVKEEAEKLAEALERRKNSRKGASTVWAAVSRAARRLHLGRRKLGFMRIRRRMTASRLRRRCVLQSALVMVRWSLR